MQTQTNLGQNAHEAIHKKLVCCTPIYPFRIILPKTFLERLENKTSFALFSFRKLQFSHYPALKGKRILKPKYTANKQLFKDGPMSVGA